MTDEEITKAFKEYFKKVDIGKVGYKSIRVYIFETEHNKGQVIEFLNNPDEETVYQAILDELLKQGLI